MRSFILFHLRFDYLKFLERERKDNYKLTRYVNSTHLWVTICWRKKKFSQLGFTFFIFELPKNSFYWSGVP